MAAEQVSLTSQPAPSQNGHAPKSGSGHLGPLPVPGLPESIAGTGVMGERVEFSPVLLTRSNMTEVHAAVSKAVAAEHLDALYVLAVSAVLSSENLNAKNAEAAQDAEPKHRRWNELVLGPRQKELEEFSRRAEGMAENMSEKESELRAAAAMEFAKRGFECGEEDFASLAAVHAMIERNVESRAAVLGRSGTADLTPHVPAWMKKVNAWSGLFVTLLTGLGLLELFGIEAKGALTSPALPVIVLMAVGLTVPVFYLAGRLGWVWTSRLEKGQKPFESVRSKAFLVGGTAVALLGATLISGIDVMGVSALAKEMGSVTDPAGQAAAPPLWIPALGLGFGGLGNLLKFWHGHLDALEAYQEDALEADLQVKIEEVRQGVGEILGQVALADQSRSQAAVLRSEIDRLRGEVSDLSFTPTYSPELVAERARERDAWTGDSGRYWTMVWGLIDSRRSSGREAGTTASPREGRGLVELLRDSWDRVRGR